MSARCGLPPEQAEPSARPGIGIQAHRPAFSPGARRRIDRRDQRVVPRHHVVARGREALDRIEALEHGRDAVDHRVGAALVEMGVEMRYVRGEHDVGDGVLAYFGWPRAHEDDAERAVRAGLQLVEAITGLEPDAAVRLQARIGIATGRVVVGDLVGEGASREEAVVGDVPNSRPVASEISPRRPPYPFEPKKDPWSQYVSGSDRQMEKVLQSLSPDRDRCRTIGRTQELCSATRPSPCSTGRGQRKTRRGFPGGLLGHSITLHYARCCRGQCQAETRCGLQT
jgi:Adenylate and Guanylate cyclase catalytic domain